MTQLNINLSHLHYFWTVASEGTIARACEKLRLTQPTISAQLRDLENSLGEKLFQRHGRRLELTDTGRVVFGYAEQIFSLSRELVDSVQGRPGARPLKLTVGIVNAVPKRIAYLMLKPALLLQENLRLICRHGELEPLLSELATHAVDVVLSDSPVTSHLKYRVFNHQLGESRISILGTQDLADQYRSNFPQSIHGAPLLLPAKHTSLRRELDYWIDKLNLRPFIRGEIDDTSLLKVFGQAGDGMFAAPTVIEAEICRQYHVELVGRIDSVRDRFYAISSERRVQHPAVQAICDTARAQLFSNLPTPDARP